MAAALAAPLLATAVGDPVAAAHAAKPAPAAPAAPTASTAPQMPDPVPPEEYMIEGRLEEMMPAALQLGADINLRSLVRSVARRQYENDTDALLSTVIAEAEMTGIVNPNEWWWQGLKSSVEHFEIDGFQYEPQINIPGIDEGIPLTDRIEVVVRPADKSVQTAQTYWLDPFGWVRPSPYLIDEQYVDTHEVWVLSVHERANRGGSTAVGSLPATIATEVKPAAGPTTAIGPQAAGTNAICDPFGRRNNRGGEYLHSWKASYKFDTFIGGKRELRLVVVSRSGQVADIYFPKVKRRHLNDWRIVDKFLTTWDRAVWGDVLSYQWLEINGGKADSISYTVAVPNSPSFTVTIATNKRDTSGGNASVVISELTTRVYDTSRVQFQVCSQGGDITDNIACGKAASASSTYHLEGYAPGRATDCDPSTALGGPHSWANADGTYPPLQPEWLQVDLGANQTFRRIVLYTTVGYEIRDFAVQIWTGAAWIPIASRTGNTDARVEIILPGPVLSPVVRVVCSRGPLIQDGYVRINELELYA